MKTGSKDCATEFTHKQPAPTSRKKSISLAHSEQKYLAPSGLFPESAVSHHSMTLNDARTAITAALGRMNAAYAETVFDEWVLVSIKAERGTILAYTGPRPDKFKQSFTSDIHPLRTELANHNLAVGDFAFAASATGTKHDACLRTGESSFLFCNQTTKTIEDIRANPLWREAQKPFVQLSELFRANPVE